METRKFDLNIDKILEDWEVYHAIREVIANALDEQIITHTKEIEIQPEANNLWHIRDYGRGISYEHLIQNENLEKTNTAGVIGKFGIGLKDAMATFDRKGVKVLIQSAHGDIVLERMKKHSFEDVVTLHACVSLPSNPLMVGTDVILSGITSNEMERAKHLFLKFSNESILEQNKYGDILSKQSKIANIYINGVKVAEEENFLFSYNITLIDAKIKKAINRERTNVGRSAYADRVKSMLVLSNTDIIKHTLVNDFKEYTTGTYHDELKWIDVQAHTVSLMNSIAKVVFLTPEQLIESANVIDDAKRTGYEVATIPSAVGERLYDAVDSAGHPICDFRRFIQDYNEHFHFAFISIEDLSLEERKIYSQTEQILDIVGGKPKNVDYIKISETMEMDNNLDNESVGLWIPDKRTIVIKRSQLVDLTTYAGTLVHEAIHAKSGFVDVTRAFETYLTSIIGNLSERLLKKQQGYVGRMLNDRRCKKRRW